MRHHERNSKELLRNGIYKDIDMLYGYNSNIFTRYPQKTGIRTIRALTAPTLHGLLRRKRQKKALKLKGKIHWEGDLDSWRKGRE